VGNLRENKIVLQLPSLHGLSEPRLTPKYSCNHAANQNRSRVSAPWSPKHNATLSGAAAAQYRHRNV